MGPRGSTDTSTNDSWGDKALGRDRPGETVDTHLPGRGARVIRELGGEAAGRVRKLMCVCIGVRWAIAQSAREDSIFTEKKQ